MLNSLDYNLKHNVINAKGQGIPHSKPRTYCVGVKRDIKATTFRFPDAGPAKTMGRFTHDSLTSSCGDRVKVPKTKRAQ